MPLPRNPLHVEQANLVTVSLIVIAAVAFAFALAWTRPVMVPFVLSVFVYYLVSPVADFLETRLRFPRWASTIVVLLIVAGGLFLLGLLITTSARGLGNSADIYREELLDFVRQVAAALDARGLDLSQDALLDSIRNLPVTRVLQASAGTALAILTNGTLVILFVIFLLLGRSKQLIKHPIFKQIDRDIRRYLVLKFLISAVTGALVWLILLAFGLDLALVFGVLAFVLNFIPSVGSIIATVLPLPIALVQFDTLGPVIAILVLLTAVQMVVGNGIDPKLMGKRLDLSPVTIVMALVFWGLLWGGVGMLLAAPLTAILRIVLAQFATTRPVTDLMAGRLPVHDEDDDGPPPPAPPPLALA
jgi:AI-2 transport protein TqsA